MTVADLDEVCEIEQNCFPFPWSKNSFYGEINENKYAYYIVARLKDHGGIIGYGGLWVIFDEGHITTLAVHPHHRRQRVGSCILEHLLEKAEALGARQVFLEVRDSNGAARGLYEKFHFKAISRRKKYYLNEDALVMVYTFPPV